jgi:adenosylmethionine-8-amino-7-oxononanoate aminotransferase
VGCAAALACLAETKRLNVAENAGARGLELQAGLQSLKEKHNLVGDARGLGLMGCLELVSDRETKQPASKETCEIVSEAAYENGVIVRISGNNLIVSPPLIIDSDHVTKIISAVGAGLTAAST